MTQRKAEVGDRVRIKVGAQAGEVGEVIELLHHRYLGEVWYKGERVARMITRLDYHVQLDLDGDYAFPSGHFDVIKRAMIDHDPDLEAQ